MDERVTPENVTRKDVQRLVADGAQLVDVLPREEYDDLHIAGALNLPLNEIGNRAPRELDRSAPIVTYCHDFL